MQCQCSRFHECQSVSKALIRQTLPIRCSHRKPPSGPLLCQPPDWKTAGKPLPFGGDPTGTRRRLLPFRTSRLDCRLQIWICTARLHKARTTHRSCLDDARLRITRLLPRAIMCNSEALPSRPAALAVHRHPAPLPLLDHRLRDFLRHRRMGPAVWRRCSHERLAIAHVRVRAGSVLRQNR